MKTLAKLCRVVRRKNSKFMGAQESCPSKCISGHYRSCLSKIEVFCL